MVEVVQRATTNYIVFPGPTELQLRETINWERATQPNPAHWTSIGGELYDPHAQEQPQLVVRRLDQVVADENPITGAGGFLKERTGEAQETYPDHDETTYEANETTTLGQFIFRVAVALSVPSRLTLFCAAVTTAPDESVSAAVWSATQPPPTNFVQNPSVNYSQLPQATPSQMLTQTVDAPQLRLDPMLVTPLDKTRQRIEEAVYDKPLINILAAIVALEHVAVPYGVTRTRWTLGDFTGATLKVTLFGNAVQWNPYVKVGDVIHLTGQSLPSHDRNFLAD